MSVFEKTTDHDTRALGDLLQQFKGRPNIEAFLRAFATKAQEVENALWQLVTERWLHTAVGAQLDLLGRLLRRDRAGLSDDVYRGILRAIIAARLSSGTHPEVLRVVQLAINAAVTGGHLKITRQPPAGAEVFLDNQALLAGLGVHVADLIALAASMGIRIVFTYIEVDSAFAFDDANIGFDDSAYGWGLTSVGA